MKVKLVTLRVATRARMKKMIMGVKGTCWMMIQYLKKIQDNKLKYDVVSLDYKLSIRYTW